MNREVWETHSNFIDESLMVLAGHDTEGSPIYIGRSTFGNNILPAKVIFKNFEALISFPFEGREQFLNTCEILVNTGFRWKDFDNSDQIPENAVQAGLTEDGVKQYIGRAFFNGVLTPGRLSADSNCLFITFDGEEIIRSSAFEILVVDEEPLCTQNISLTLNSPNNSNALSETVRTQTITLAPKSTCSICLEERIDIVGVFMDCGHACLCEGCIAKVNEQRQPNGKVKCPICRTENISARKIFYI